MMKAIVLSLSMFASQSNITHLNVDSGPKLQPPSRLNTNESFIDDLLEERQLDIDDPRAVLSFVLNSLPEEVNVYPTENYYYVKFHQGGVGYAGNIRLDAADRDDGIIHFTYFREIHDSSRANARTIHASESDGLLMRRMEPFVYRVDFDGKSTLFRLNDLSDVKPTENHIGPEEIYIGPIFDESGIQFFLIFNRVLKVFHYVLNDTSPVPEEMIDSVVSPHIQIGLRTRFAFYKDPKRQRSILIGVPEQNVRENNYYDGPFDQLPDNFIVGDTFSDAFRLSKPDFPLAIDRFGRTSSTTRVLIRPYELYNAESDLRKIDRCATRFQNSDIKYYRCFDVDD